MRLKIGELAKLAACPVVTIRYYEKEGLMHPPMRTTGNYRIYEDEDIRRLRFIKHCRRQGITLAEIRRLLHFRDHPDEDCGFVHQLVLKHMADIDAQIEQLLHLKMELEALAGENKCGHKGHCAILHMLDSPDDCPYCHELHAREDGREIKKNLKNRN